MRIDDPAIPQCVGPGWSPIVSGLCSHIAYILKRYCLASEDLKVVQVKEKLGGLRFYCCMEHTEDEHKKRQQEGAWSDVRSLVTAAEIHCDQTCEYCGEPGELDESQAWLKVRCPECKAKKVTWRDACQTREAEGKK